MSSWPPPQRPRAHISQMPYMPGLDGLRALAVIAVMLYHANHEWLSGGFLGVEVFFVISGYLITLLLIGEHERAGRVNIGQFWRRRFRRLLPALYVMMGLLALYLAVSYRRPQGRTRGDFLGGIFYGSNWYQIVVGQSYTAVEAFAPLRHLWSLAVEEQFYLLWPLVMVLILRRGRDRLPRVGLWLAGASAAIAVVVGVLFVGGDVADECGTGRTHGYATVFGHCININDTLYLSTFTRTGGLLLGAAFAMLWRPLALLRGPMRNKGHLLDLFALAGVAVLALLMFKLTISGSGDSVGSRYNPWLFRGGFFLTGLATLSIIAAVAHRRAFFGRALGNPLLNWVGTRSYGLYLFHWPIYQIVRKFAGVPLTARQFLIAIAITLPVTELSYRLVETPVRSGRFARWLRGEARIRSGTAARNRRRVVVLVAALSTGLGFAGVSIAVAKNVCAGDVECSIQRANELAVRQLAAGPFIAPVVVPTTQLARRATTTTDDTPGTTDTTDTASSIAEAAASDVTAVGAAPPGTGAVETTPPAAPDTTAPAATPDTAAAATSPPTTDLPATVETIDHAIQPIALGESVMLGALPDLQEAGFFVDALKGRQGQDMAALVEAMRTNNQLGPVIVIQIGTNGSVSNEDFRQIMQQLPPDLAPVVVFLTVRVPKKWQDGNNTLIRALPDTYPNVRVLDWQAASMAISICADGTHIACGSGMAQYYSNLIFDAIGRPDLKR